MLKPAVGAAVQGRQTTILRSVSDFVIKRHELRLLARNSCSDHRSCRLDGGPMRGLLQVRLRFVEQETYHPGGQDQLQSVRKTQRRAAGHTKE